LANFDSNIIKTIFEKKLNKIKMAGKAKGGKGK
jgi:hypothetical protein